MRFHDSTSLRPPHRTVQSCATPSAPGRGWRLFFAAAALMLAACRTTGPSKARYAELLHECREHDREHLRMLKAYESPKGCVSIKRGENTMEKLQPLWHEAEITACPVSSNPEQAHGSVEMGLGGY